jgi:tetratricopeptide (TPR) repeat protein
VAKHKAIVNELKQPDQFLGFWGRVGERAGRAWEAQKRPILLGATALVVVVVGSVVVGSRQESQALAATRAYSKIEKMLDTPLAPEGEPPPGTPPPDGPQFRTEAERREAVQKEVDAFLAKFGDNALAIDASLVKARWTSESNPDEAISVYEKMLDNRALKPTLRFLVLEGLGYAFEAKGNFDKAHETYQRLADEKGDLSTPAFRDRALFDQARIAEKKGDKAGAAKLYHEIVDKYPTSPVKRDAMDRLALVEGK